jgi:hypothetical protein
MSNNVKSVSSSNPNLEEMSIPDSQTTNGELGQERRENSVESVIRIDQVTSSRSDAERSTGTLVEHEKKDITEEGAEPVPKIMTTPSTNPFDDPDLELKDVTDGQLAVRKFTKIPIAKPNKSWWFRVNSEFPRVVRGILLDELDTSAGLGGRPYVVSDAIKVEFERLVRPNAIHIYVNRQGTPGIWLIPTRDSEGRQNDSWVSQEKAAALARTKWIAMEWNQGTRSYSIAESPRDLGPPQFPAYLLTMNDYLLLAFGEHGIIKNLDNSDHRKIIEELLKVRL